jgi:cytochrome P450
MQPAPGVPEISGFDPFANAYRLDSAAAVQATLRTCPVGWFSPMNCFMVLRYEEARAVLRDYETFSSQLFRALTTPGLDPERERVVRLVIEGQALNMDPPAHTGERRLLQRSFTNSQVTSALPDVKRIAHELIDAFFDRGSCDLMNDYSYKLSLRTVAGMIGFPAEELPAFEGFITDIFTLMFPLNAARNPLMTPARIAEAALRTHTAYTVFSEFVESRRRRPCGDLASTMLALHDDGGRPLMTNDAALAHVVGITVAGTGTTANLIGSVARGLSAEPEILAEVRADPTLWEQVVEEGLRRWPPSSTLYRLATRDAELAGVRIPAGSMVAVNVAAANADPAHFPDPLRFDPRRPNVTDHLGFGAGRHFCLGSPLARPEARIALETLYDRIPDFTADLSQEVEFAANFVARSMLSLRASWSVPARA